MTANKQIAMECAERLYDLIDGDGDWDALDAIRIIKETLLRSNAEREAKVREFVDASDAFLERYLTLVNSGDCGDWNPEEEDEVIRLRAARKALGI